mmetsp:Transcript_6875/g.16304  ORF Transcript_6875/g.16304 Transcript_6875/m.16304 type:complete len:202 (+) Transcript_6875:53-658(+)
MKTLWLQSHRPFRTLASRELCGRSRSSLCLGALLQRIRACRMERSCQSHGDATLKELCFRPAAPPPPRAAPAGAQKRRTGTIRLRPSKDRRAAQRLNPDGSRNWAAQYFRGPCSRGLCAVPAARPAWALSGWWRRLRPRCGRCQCAGKSGGRSLGGGIPSATCWKCCHKRPGCARSATSSIAWSGPSCSPSSRRGYGNNRS